MATENANGQSQKMVFPRIYEAFGILDTRLKLASGQQSTQCEVTF